MDEEKLREEKVRLENKLKEMCQKTEDERNLEHIKLLNEYNSVKDAVQVSLLKVSFVGLNSIC